MDKDFGALKVDMNNAFNQVSSQALLSECAEHFCLGSAGTMGSIHISGTPWVV